MERGFFIHWLTRAEIETVGVVTAKVGLVTAKVGVVTAKVGLDIVASVVCGATVVVFAGEGVGVPLVWLEEVEGVVSANCSRMILA